MKRSLLALSVLLAAACGTRGVTTTTSSTGSALTVEGTAPANATDIYAVEAAPKGTQPASIRASVGADNRFTLALPRERTYTLVAVNNGAVIGSVRFSSSRTGSTTTSLLHIPAEPQRSGFALEGALELGEVEETSAGVLTPENNPLAMLDSDADGEEDLDDADDDGDGKGDAEDDDADGDGQDDDDADHDEDDDGKIDACDDDDDGDGVADAEDGDHHGKDGDSDADGVSDERDDDDDNDGIDDSNDDDENGDGVDEPEGEESSGGD